MALDLGCATRQPYYGDGSEVVFLYDFEILKTEDLHVAYWDNTKEEYFEILPDHPVHGWAKLDSLSKIKFNSPIADGQFFIIYRLTEVAPPKAFFVKGHPVKADDLNDNFEQLQFAILDNRCSIERLEENGNKEAGCSGTFRASFIVSDTNNKIELPAGFNSTFSGALFVYLNGVLLSTPTEDTTQQSKYSIFNEGAKFYLSFDYAPFESDVVDFVYSAPVDCDSPDLSPVANRSTTNLTEAVSQITLPLDFDQARMNEYVYLNGILLTKSEYTIYEQGLYFYYIQDDGSLASNSLNDGDIVDFIYSGGILDVPTPQVQSNWAETDEFSVSYILNKPTIPTIDPDTVVDPNYVATDENFTTADHIKLDSIETGAQANIPNTVVDPNYVATDENFTTADHIKLDSIETGAQVNIPNTVVDPNYVSTDENFTTADHSKLNGIEAGAQVNTVTSVNGLTGAVTLSSSGGSSFNGNYNDLFNKPTLGSAAATDSTDYATAAQGALADTALQSHQDISNKADLVGGKLNTSQIPDLAVTEYLGAVANQTAMLALTGEKGDWCNRSDTGQMFIISGTDPTQLASWAAISYPASPVVSVAGKTGAVTLTNNDISGGAVTATTGTYSGNVGIGTSSPNSSLHVSAAQNILFRLASTTNSNNSRMVFAPNNTDKWNIGVNVSDSSFTFYDTSAATTPIAIKSSGNVGIGTTSPQAKLDVNGTAFVGEGGEDNEILRLNTDRTWSFFQRGSGAQTSLDLASGDNKNFTISSRKTGETSASASVFINGSDGNVGIKQTSPDHLLHIGDNTNALGGTAGDQLDNFKIQSQTAGNSDALTFTNERISTGSDWTTAAQRIQRKVDSTLMGYIQFGNAFGSDLITFGEGTTEYARFDGSGNFGIGTTNPTQELDVNGTIEANDLTINGSSFRNIPKNSKTAAYTLLVSDLGKVVCITTGGVTIPSGVFSSGDAVTIYNDSGSNQTITQGSSVTLRTAGTSTAGNKTLAGYGLCTVLCVASNVFVVGGAGLS